MYCTNCGKELSDEAIICPACGTPTGKELIVTSINSQSTTLSTFTKVFMILGCVLSAFHLLIPLCWTIPMTVKYFRSIRESKPVSTAFKVCSLLFVSLIAGILMLCDNKSS